MTNEELVRLKAVAFGQSELEFDQTFWSDGGTTVQALITEIERLTQREAKARAIMEPMAECDAEIREWLK